MTPFRSRRDRGTLELRIKYRGLPIIRRAAGTNDESVLRDLRQMCDLLYELPRHDLLRSLAAGVIPPLTLLQAYRRGKLHELSAGDMAANLRTAWAAWAGTLPAGSHRHDIEGCGRRMIQADATVGEIPKVLREHRTRMSQKHQAFNHARNYCRAFVRDTLGPSDALMQRVVDIQPYPTPARAKGHPLTVEKLAALLDRLGPDHGAAFLGMAMTGMGPKEYWGRWEDEETHLMVYGTKRRQRERMVPRAGTVPVPMVTRYAFESKIRRLRTPVNPYDARRTFSNLMIQAGIPRNRRRMYLGHGATDSTDLYEQPELMDWIMADGRAMAALLQPVLTRRLRIERAG